MAEFMTSLWESVFTPGPTPTLLIAANASFGSLQVVLAILFFLTYSAHFVALSVICAGVWWGINWFAIELRKAQLAEEEAERIRKSRSGGGGEGAAEASGGDAGDEDTETEREDEGKATPNVAGLRLRGGPNKMKAVLQSAGYDTSGLERKSQGKHEPSTNSSQGLESGTDSEWEKVSETDK